MRRLSVLFIAIVMIFSLVGCGGEKSTESPLDAATLDEELLRAVSYGIVTVDELTDLSRTITYAEFCAMLTKVVAMRGEQYIPEWETLAAAALQSDEPMQQDDALLAMFEASVVMGIDREQVVMGDWETDSTASDWWEGISRDYALFDNWQEPYADIYDGNMDYDMSYHAAWHFEKVPSTVSGLLPFEPNEKMTYDFSKDVSFEDAVRALTRLIESNAKITEEDPVYISLDEVGTYDSTIITEELLSRVDEFPVVSQAELPSEWKGCGLSCCKDGRHIYRDFRESDIAFLAENGFNFARLFFGFDTLRFPDYPEDGRLVNENELKELDQLIAWGMEYGIHIQISLSFYLDENGDCKREDNSDYMMPENDAQWEIVSDYWTMLARRYAGIPNEFLSFDLANELQPSEENLANATENMKELVSGLRAVDPERVLLISFNDNPLNAWVENMAEIGLALGCHPYAPVYLCGGDDTGLYTAPTAYWPYPYFPAKLNVGENIKISGDIGGNVLKIDFWVYRPFMVTFSDGTVLTVDGQGDYIDEMSCDWRFNKPYAIEIPESVSELVIAPKSEDLVISELIMECDGEMTGLIPADSMEYSLSGGAELIWTGDRWSSEKVYNADLLYTEKIQPMQQIAKEHSVGFMIGEFGVFADADWDIALVTAYQESMMEIFAEKEIGWCFCELHNGGTHLLLREPVESQWANATTEPVDLGYNDGSCRVVVEMLESFRKYTVK